MKIPVEPACMFPAESEVYGYLDNLRHILFKKKKVGGTLKLLNFI